MISPFVPVGLLALVAGIFLQHFAKKMNGETG
jgi:hypothetical protein